MEITVLGCWAPYPAPGGACPGYLVKSGQKSVLLDCGNGILGKLQEHLDFRRLDAVLISHLHPDHYLDLFPLRHAIEGSLRDGTRKAKLKLFLPSQPRETFIQLYNFKNAFEIIPIEALAVTERIEEEEVREFKLSDFCTVKFFPTKHPMLTYSIVIEESGAKLKRFAYSGDTGYKQSLIEFWHKADLLLVEASLQEEHKEMTKLGHLTAKEAGQLGQAAQVEKLVLTHFWPEFDLQISAQEAEAGFTREVELAGTGNKHII